MTAASRTAPALVAADTREAAAAALLAGAKALAMHAAADAAQEGGGAPAPGAADTHVGRAAANVVSALQQRRMWAPRVPRCLARA